MVFAIFKPHSLAVSYLGFTYDLVMFVYFEAYDI